MIKSATLTLHLIANPVAGKGRARALLMPAISYLTERGASVNSYITQRPGDATRYTCKLPPDATVLSLGGDGTLHEIASACIGTARTIGILPAGSGDDFAYALGIARHSLREACDIILEGSISRVDTGSVNGTPFVNALGVGFDAEVAHNMRLAPAYLKERAAYLHAIFRTMRELETPKAQVEVDGQLIYRGPALLVSVQNGPRTGGSFLFAPAASVDDGQFEVVIATKLGRAGILRLLPKVIKGKHLGHPKVLMTRGKHIKLRWEKARPGHVEGELLAAASEFDIHVNPKSLRVFVP